MHTIRSAGFILFRQNKKKEVLFLLLRSRAGFWGFPKGRLKKNEKNRDAAARELYEETGIHSFFIISGFSSLLSYHTSAGSPKTLSLQTAKTDQVKVIISREHTKFAWVNYSEAYKLLFFANSKRALKSCYNYIKHSQKVIALQEEVYQVVQKIQKGKVGTYKGVGISLIKKTHPRTVGIILNKNYNTKVPCHRVVSSDGSIGGYNKGAFEKIRKLQQEGIEIGGRGRQKCIIDFKRFCHTFSSL